MAAAGDPSSDPPRPSALRSARPRPSRAPSRDAPRSSSSASEDVVGPPCRSAAQPHTKLQAGAPGAYLERPGAGARSSRRSEAHVGRSHKAPMLNVKTEEAVVADQGTAVVELLQIARWSPGDAVRYWSQRFQDWIPTTVLGKNEDGTYQLKCKPNVNEHQISDVPLNRDAGISAAPFTPAGPSAPFTPAGVKPAPFTPAGIASAPFTPAGMGSSPSSAAAPPELPWHLVYKDEEENPYEVPEGASWGTVLRFTNFPETWKQCHKSVLEGKKMPLVIARSFNQEVVYTIPVRHFGIRSIRSTGNIAVYVTYWLMSHAEKVRARWHGKKSKVQDENFWLEVKVVDVTSQSPHSPVQVVDVTSQSPTSPVVEARAADPSTELATAPAELTSDVATAAADPTVAVASTAAEPVTNGATAAADPSIAGASAAAHPTTAVATAAAESTTAGATVAAEPTTDMASPAGSSIPGATTVDSEAIRSFEERRSDQVAKTEHSLQRLAKIAEPVGLVLQYLPPVDIQEVGNSATSLRQACITAIARHDTALEEAERERLAKERDEEEGVRAETLRAEEEEEAVVDDPDSPSEEELRLLLKQEFAEEEEVATRRIYVDELCSNPGVGEGKEVFVSKLGDVFQDEELKDWLSTFDGYLSCFFVHVNGEFVGQLYARFDAHPNAKKFVEDVHAAEANEEEPILASWSVSEQIRRVGIQDLLERLRPVKDDLGSSILLLVADGPEAEPLHFVFSQAHRLSSEEDLRARLIEFLTEELHRLRQAAEEAAPATPAPATAAPATEHASSNSSSSSGVIAGAGQAAAPTTEEGEAVEHGSEDACPRSPDPSDGIKTPEISSFFLKSQRQWEEEERRLREEEKKRQEEEEERRREEEEKEIREKEELEREEKRKLEEKRKREQEEQEQRQREEELKLEKEEQECERKRKLEEDEHKPDAKKQKTAKEAMEKAAQEKKRAAAEAKAAKEKAVKEMEKAAEEKKRAVAEAKAAAKARAVKEAMEKAAEEKKRAAAEAKAAAEEKAVKKAMEKAAEEKKRAAAEEKKRAAAEAKAAEQKAVKEAMEQAAEAEKMPAEATASQGKAAKEAMKNAGEEETRTPEKQRNKVVKKVAKEAKVNASADHKAQDANASAEARAAEDTAWNASFWGDPPAAKAADDKAAKQVTPKQKVEKQDKRWSAEGWDRLKGLSCEIQPSERGATKSMTSGKDADKAPLPVPPVSLLPPPMRRMYVTKADVKKIGHTPGCNGCACLIVSGRADTPHNDQCRLRIAEHRRKRRGVDDSAGSPVQSKALKGIRLDEESKDDVLMQQGADLAGGPARSSEETASSRNRPAEQSTEETEKSCKEAESSKPGVKRGAEQTAEDLQQQTDHTEVHRLSISRERHRSRSRRAKCRSLDRKRKRSCSTSSRSCSRGSRNSSSEEKYSSSSASSTSSKKKRKQKKKSGNKKRDKKENKEKQREKDRKKENQLAEKRASEDAEKNKQKEKDRKKEQELAEKRAFEEAEKAKALKNEAKEREDAWQKKKQEEMDAKQRKEEEMRKHNERLAFKQARKREEEAAKRRDEEIDALITAAQRHAEAENKEGKRKASQQAATPVDPPAATLLDALMMPPPNPMPMILKSANAPHEFPPAPTPLATPVPMPPKAPAPPAAHEPAMAPLTNPAPPATLTPAAAHQPKTPAPPGSFAEAVAAAEKKAAEATMTAKAKAAKAAEEKAATEAAAKEEAEKNSQAVALHTEVQHFTASLHATATLAFAQPPPRIAMDDQTMPASKEQRALGALSKSGKFSRPQPPASPPPKHLMEHTIPGAVTAAGARTKAQQMLPTGVRVKACLPPPRKKASY